MGKPTGFKEYPRRNFRVAPIQERARHYREFLIPLPIAEMEMQGARCMDCGVPFCHTGCPLGNIIPDFNDLVYRGDWQRAIQVLHATNNFPEFTGRVCPAPCEEACVLGITDPPVAIKSIEYSIVEKAFAENWIRPCPTPVRTGNKVAVVGSGPAGLAVADQLNRAGHWVTVFERADRIGGLLRYGIPDFKLDKQIIDRRLAILRAEGITFRAGVNVGLDIDAEGLRSEFHVVVLCGGATRPRDLPIPGRELDGVHFAMEFLPQQNKRVAGDNPPYRTDRWWFSNKHEDLTASGKRVIVIGGGDTGSDCVGTSNRQGARSVTQFELLPQPPEGRPDEQPWPYWPMKLRTSSSHEEGCNRYWSVLTKRLIGENGRVTGLKTVDVVWTRDENGRMTMEEVPGSDKTWAADLVLLALGFVGPEKGGIIEHLGVALDERGNIKADEETFATNVPGVFACGDVRRGQSLVVWAISEGREAAVSIDKYLMGASNLPTKGPGDLPRV